MTLVMNNFFSAGGMHVLTRKQQR